MQYKCSKCVNVFFFIEFVYTISMRKSKIRNELSNESVIQLSTDWEKTPSPKNVLWKIKLFLFPFPLISYHLQTLAQYERLTNTIILPPTFTSIPHLNHDLSRAQFRWFSLLSFCSMFCLFFLLLLQNFLMPTAEVFLCFLCTKIV